MKSLLETKNSGKVFIDNFLNEIGQHPLLLNPQINEIIPSRLKPHLLHYIDPELYSDAYEHEDYEESVGEIANKELDQSIKKISSSTKNNGPVSTTDFSNERLTLSHFKWLLAESDQNRFLKSNSRYGLEKKIAEFCEWAEKSYDCNKELELDSITLMKIFLVNYDKGPLMWVPNKIERETNRKFLNEIYKYQYSMISPNLVNDRNSETDLELNILSKPKKVQSEVYKCNNKYKQQSKNVKVVENEPTLNNKEHKLENFAGVKLFVDFFKARKNCRIPYSLAIINKNLVRTKRSTYAKLSQAQKNFKLSLNNA